LNADACEAAARLLIRAQSLGATKTDHYLMPKNLSRISHGVHKSEHGYDVLQHQTDWGAAWTALTKAAGFPDLRFHDLRHSFITHARHKRSSTCSCDAARCRATADTDCYRGARSI
jgi:integrase